MKNAVMVLLPVCLVLCLLLAGCPASVQPRETGSLILRFAADEMAARTIVPDLDMDIAYYNILGDGPDPASFSQNGVTVSTVTRNYLAVGAWTITVDAFNDADEWIGSGSAAVAITAGDTTEEEVHVTPLEGTAGPQHQHFLACGDDRGSQRCRNVDSCGGSPQSIAFSMGTDSASASYAVLDMGYYALTLRLSDGSTVKWGCFEAVRILKEQTTQATFTLTADDVSTGGVEITIVPDMEDPITISFSGQQASLMSGTNMTVTATTSEPVDTYQWYLDGAAVGGATASSVTIGGDFRTGPIVSGPRGDQGQHHQLKQHRVLCRNRDESYCLLVIHRPASPSPTSSPCQ